MANAQEIADFVRWYRAKRDMDAWAVFPQTLSSTQEIADDLLALAEFQALGLADWLQTPDGALIEQAVGVVISPVYAPEYRVLIDGLTLAAHLQHKRGRKQAGLVGLVAIGLALFLAFGGSSN
jgi:hypothetical protein